MENNFQKDYFAKMTKVESIIGQIRIARSPEEVNGLVAVIARDPSMSDFVRTVFEAQAEWKRRQKINEPKFGRKQR